MENQVPTTPRPQDIFTVLYEVRGQQYIIGVTNEKVPTVAAVGVNTRRPLPQNARRAFIAAALEIRQLKPETVITLIDYNSPAQQVSSSILDNFLETPVCVEDVTKTVGEAVAELKAKMRKDIQSIQESKEAKN